MPVDILVNIPSASDIFLDTNIFIYALTGRSPQCEDVLARCARQDIFGVTTFEVINETTHRLMVHEAFDKGLIPRPRAEDLRQRTAVVRSLTDYWIQVSQLFVMNLIVVAAEESILRRAQIVREDYGLLTLDSLVVATMKEYEIQRLASHDRDFDPIASLTVHHPTDIP